MAKEPKPQQDGHGIYEKDGAYHCAECHYEVPMEQDCPNCKAHIDWERALHQLSH